MDDIKTNKPLLKNPFTIAENPLSGFITSCFSFFSNHEDITHSQKKIAYLEFVALTEKINEDFERLLPIIQQLNQLLGSVTQLQCRVLAKKPELAAFFYDPIQLQEQYARWRQNIVNYPTYEHISIKSEVDELKQITKDLEIHHNKVMNDSNDLFPYFLNHEESRLREVDDIGKKYLMNV